MRPRGHPDASSHDWLEKRGVRLTRCAAIDDATGQVLAALFRSVEDAHGYFLLMRALVATHGRPLAVYHDRQSIFRVATRGETVAEQLAGGRERTQCGRLRDALGIAGISARSPQAKGRVERLCGTLQDRLVSVLRLAGATTMADANDVLTTFVPAFNVRFGVPAADETACYRPVEAGSDLGALFCFTYQRTVGMDNTVRLGEHRLQLLPQRQRQSWARAGVEVREHLNGALSVHHAGQCLLTTAAPLEAPVLRARGGRRAPATPGGATVSVAPSSPRQPAMAAAVAGKTKPGAHHPWRQGYRPRQDTITEQLE